MSKKAAENSQKIILLAGATVIALGVAGWQVVNALAPAPSAKVTVSTVQPVASANPGTQSPETMASGQAPAVSRDSSRSEALLATSADPFFPRLTKTAVVRITPPGASAGSPSGNAASGPPAPALPRVAGIPGGAPFSVPPRAAHDTTPPVLVGTLLGEQSSAVFRDGQNVKIVPVGEKYGLWKVVAVSHGDATLRVDGHTLRLAVGEPSKEKDKLTVGGSSSAHPMSGLEITVRAADPANGAAEGMQTMASTAPMHAPAETADPFRNPEAPAEPPQPSELEKSAAPSTAPSDSPAAPDAPRVPTE